MRKILLLLPFLLFSLVVCATKTTITADETNSLHVALANATPGDTIVLSSGTYTENKDEGYITFDKNITVMAANNASKPVIMLYVPAVIQSGARAEVKGLKFDATHLKQASYYTHFFYSADASDNNRLIFDDCEFYNDTINSAVIYCASDKKLDSLIIANCTFNAVTKSCVFLDNPGLVGLNVTNSTFANVSTNAKYYAGVVDARTSTGKILIDHCTFYNCQAMNTDYGAVKIPSATDVLVSNCIFMMPSSYAGGRAVYNTNGEVKNCLTYNYTQDSSPSRGIHSGPTITDCSEGDPVFTNAASANFTLSTTSPAIMASDNWTPLGDKRWWPTLSFSSTDFASPYAFTSTTAKLIGNIRLNGNSHIEYYDKDVCGKAGWGIHVTKAAAVQATLNMESGSSSGHIFKIVIFDAEGNRVDSVAELDYSSSDGNIVVPGSMFFPKAGDYYVGLYNTQSYSSAKIESVSLAYVGGEVQNIPCTTNNAQAWYSARGTRADGMITFTSYTDQWVKWHIATSGTVQKAYAVTLNINSPSAYGHRFSVNIYEYGKKDAVATLKEPSWNETYGTPLAIEMGTIALYGGKEYVAEVTNAESGAQPKIISLGFTSAGGDMVEMPGTASVNDAWYSSNGTRADGAITYSSVGSGCWAKWNISVAKDGVYDVAMNIRGKYGHDIAVEFLKEGSTTPQTISEGKTVYDNDQTLYKAKIGAIALTAGNYVMTVSNSIGDAAFLSAVLEYAGGAVVNLPANPIPLGDALLSSRAYREGGNLYFTDADHYGTIADEWAKWNIHATVGLYNFTLNVAGSNEKYSKYELTITDASNNEIAKVEKGKSGTGEVNINQILIVEEGDYELKLANVNNHADGYLTGFSASKAENVLFIDEDATDNTVIDLADGTTPSNIVLQRSFLANMYNTVCLPFRIGNTELTKVFGEGYQLMEFVSAILEETVLTLNFEARTELTHGRPFLIKPTKDVSNPVIEGHSIDKSTGYNEKDGGDVSFIGSFHAGTIAADPRNLFVGKDDKLYFPTDTKTIKGMRAYFRVNTSIPNPKTISRARIVEGNQVVTEIEFIDGEWRTIDTQSSTKLIQNGQLVIIRDGVRYNALGQIIE